MVISSPEDAHDLTAVPDTPESAAHAPKHYYAVHSSPLGEIYLATDGQALTGAWFAGQDHFASAKELGSPLNMTDSPLLSQAAQELDQYFSGSRKTFTLPLAPEGTDFQLAVWEALKDIPFGYTTTYGAISKIVGPHAPAQAVGQAVGRNKCMIFIPCHRVISASGQLTGYSAGLEKKQFLLELENPEPDEGTLF